MMNLKIILLLTVGLWGGEWAEGAAEWGAEAGVAGLAATRDARGLQDTAPQHLTSLQRQVNMKIKQKCSLAVSGTCVGGSQRIDAIPDPDPTIKIGKS